MDSTKKKYWLIGGGVFAALLFLVVLVSSLDSARTWFDSVLRVFRPLLIGLIVAYLLNPFFRFFENKLFRKISQPRVRRVISLTCSYLFLLSVFVVLVLLIVPQLVQSILDFVDDAESYLTIAIDSVNSLIRSINTNLLQSVTSNPIPYLDAAFIKNAFFEFIKSVDLKGKLINFLTFDSILALLGIVRNVFSIFLDVIFGFFISLYLLNTKEKRYAQIMRYRRAFLNDTINAHITHFCKVADRSFGGFLEGKIIDSCIVGVLVYIAISIFNVPYAILIATVVAITDIVPVIGPFIGVVPSAVIVLLSDPSKVIPFVLCILVIQQIDGNILAPKILGENTGVSSLCVIIAIAIMGSLWGLAGMVLGVPLFATVLELANAFLDKRLKKKGIQPPPKKEEPKNESIFDRFKNRSLRLQKNYTESGGGDLSRLERLQLDTYSLAVKYHIFSESSDDALSRFVTERNALLSALNKDTEATPSGEKTDQNINEAAQTDAATESPEEKEKTNE